MIAKRVNCKADYRFQVDARTFGAGGTLGQASSSDVAEIRLRLSATETGSAIHAEVDGLLLTEVTSQPSSQKRRIFREIDKQILTDRILPLGRGTTFWAIYSKSGDMDMYAVPYIVDDRTRVR
jgi:hypothetical protein